MIEKSPATFKFARIATCADSKAMVTDSDKNMQRFSVIIDMLVHAKWISVKNADDAKI